MVRIGVLTYPGQSPESLQKYLEFAGNFGDAKPIAFDLYDKAEHILGMDLLILCGGADVNPARYKQKPIPETGASNPFLEYFDLNVLPIFIKKGIPIFGICRGHQTVAVHFGCRLNQHVTPSKDIFGETRKIEKIHWNTLSGEQEINTFHHQTVLNYDAYRLLEAEVIVNEDAQVEALIYTCGKIITVQWHPELMSEKCEFSHRAIKHLLER
jgi:putative glutamine amidotransferase